MGRHAISAAVSPVDCACAWVGNGILSVQLFLRLIVPVSGYAFCLSGLE